MAKKTTCPITRAQFRADARPIKITIGDKSMEVPVKFFSTNSLGWYLNSKTTMNVGGAEVAVQIGLNMTIVGSKELPPEPAAAAHAPHTAHAPHGDGKAADKPAEAPAE
jgi:hypothetical protein